MESKNPSFDVIFSSKEQETKNSKRYFRDKFNVDFDRTNFEPEYAPLYAIKMQPLSCFHLTVLMQAIQNPPGFAPFTYGGRQIELPDNVSIEEFNQTIKQYQKCHLKNKNTMKRVHSGISPKALKEIESKVVAQLTERGDLKKKMQSVYVMSNDRAKEACKLFQPRDDLAEGSVSVSKDWSTITIKGGRDYRIDLMYEVEDFLNEKLGSDKDYYLYIVAEDDIDNQPRWVDQMGDLP